MLKNLIIEQREEIHFMIPIVIMNETAPLLNVGCTWS